ncbi:PilW family protein [Deinococcus cellulosilyticus]|uniref:PilW family protein n=1 Tax=Deinococcus cellulosilyticus TaxID=401558 RepID=UPI0011BF4CD8|nr:hypothetical protein [Deinococcus cellulosilyticus]
MTLLELLITLCITGLILVLTSSVLVSARHSATLQASHDLLQQDLTLSQMLLQEQVSTAGYLGGDPADFQGKDWTREEQSGLLEWLAEHIREFGLKSIALPDGDRIELSRLSRIWKTAQALVYRMEFLQITFGLSRSRNLVWTNRSVLCEVQTTPAKVSCTPEAGTVQPAVEHLEAFEVFFLHGDGQWQANLPSADDMRAIGFYLRFKTPEETGRSCGRFPAGEVRLPAAASVLGIPVHSDPAPCHARRLEGMQVVHLGGQQWY